MPCTSIKELPPAPPGRIGWPWTEGIASVLLQGYPNLEYFVLDGGSRDGSVEIIKKYAPWLTHPVSERDSGQSD